MSARRDIVLLHGWASHPQVFRVFARMLEPHARVHVLALPGYGAAAACAPYTLERMAQVLAREAPKHCTVLGWSLGAQVALTWARIAPRQVERLVLVAATPCFTERSDGKNAWPHGVSALLMRQFTSALQRDAPSLLRRFVALQGQGDAQAVRVAHKLRTALFTNPLPSPEALGAGLELLRSGDLRALLPAIAQPALVLHGERDAVTPCAAGEALAAGLSHAQFEKISAAGHAPFLSRADAMAARIGTFLNDAVEARCVDPPLPYPLPQSIGGEGIS